MKLRFKQVDVFTRVPFHGNPVAVVLAGDSLATETMQRIAAWTNLSETTFVLAPESPAADYRLRIFTPRTELPFAGHPTIGSAHAVLEAGIVKPRDGCLRQACGAGVVELRVEGERLWLKAPPAKLSSVAQERRAEMEAALGAPVMGEPRIVDVGPVWLVAELAGAAAVDACAPDLARVAAASEALGITGITIFGATSAAGCAMHVRSFAPAHGIAEDPVCGSGNISVAACLAGGGGLARFGAQYAARQGMALGRDGRVAIRVDGGEIYLGGQAVTAVEGELRVS